MDEWFECNVTQKHRTMPKLKTKPMGADVERKRAKGDEIKQRKPGHG